MISSPDERRLMTDAEEYIIVRLRRQHKSYKEICISTGWSNTSVRLVCRKHKVNRISLPQVEPDFNCTDGHRPWLKERE